jgi:alpha-glucosidase
VDKHFGVDETLAELSAALHANGMKLILDISINHTGAAHRWFNRDGLYFDRSEGAFNNPDAPERKFYFFHEGNTYTEWKGIHDLPTLNYTSEELRDIIYRRPDSVLRKWLRPPYSIAGGRFDVADVFARNGEYQLAHELWPEIRKAIREENPEAYILAEDWGDCAQYLQGDEWDSPMNYFGFGRPVRQLLGENDWFQNDSPTLRGCKFRLSAEDFEGRVLDHLGRMPFALQENQFNLFDSHDIARLSSDESVPFDHWRGAVCLQFAMPGCPSIYYGDETDIGGWFHSMEGCRFPMPWGRDFTRTEQYRMMKTLAKLKTSREALQTGGFKFLYAKGRTVAISRFTEQEAFVAVLTTEEQEQTVILPLGAVGASGIRADVLGHNVRWKKLDEKHVTLTLNPGEALFLELEMKD